MMPNAGSAKPLAPAAGGVLLLCYAAAAAAIGTLALGRRDIA
jgi:hypothetical protein